MLQGDEVAERFTHLLPVDGNHVVVHPVAHHLVALTCYSLCYLAFVVWEHQIHAATVYVKMVAEIFAPHRRALAVPYGKAVAPRAGPAHDVLWHGSLPERKVGLTVLFVGA